ncbi:Uncharacterised protein [uncultured archaeon]|nr:Uncharacterised protein [uncultured archaeon]
MQTQPQKQRYACKFSVTCIRRIWISPDDRNSCTRDPAECPWSLHEKVKNNEISKQEALAIIEKLKEAIRKRTKEELENVCNKADELEAEEKKGKNVDAETQKLEEQAKKWHYDTLNGSDDYKQLEALEKELA